MNHETDIAHLLRSIELADVAVETGNHPFAAVLVAADGEVLGERGNEHTIDKGPGHAETNLARWAAREYSLDVLRGATLYTSVEPCVMCSGTIYWAEIGTVVYGMDETRLAELTGDDPENATMSLDCRTVFAAGQHQVQVRGPFPELEEQIVAQHIDFWN